MLLRSLGGLVGRKGDAEEKVTSSWKAFSYKHLCAKSPLKGFDAKFVVLTLVARAALHILRSVDK